MKDKILDCGHTSSAKRGKQTDYAIYEGKTVCYDCVVILTKAQMVTDTTMVGYLSESGNAITTWPGDAIVDITSMWRIGHNMYPGYLTYWRGRDSEGRQWYGKCSGRGMSTIMHRAKRRA